MIINSQYDDHHLGQHDQHSTQVTPDTKFVAFDRPEELADLRNTVVFMTMLMMMMPIMIMRMMMMVMVMVITIIDYDDYDS